MLTGYQASTGAYQDQDGELYCENCFDRGDSYARPVSNYELDEAESAYAEGTFDESDDHVAGCGCAFPLECSGCYSNLTEGYTDPECEALEAANLIAGEYDAGRREV